MEKQNLALKSHRMTVRMTGPMVANLRRLAGSDRHIGEEIRTAVRLYLDNKAEITGSRRYFTGQFRDAVDALRQEIRWHLTLITILLAEMFSVLILHTVEMDEQTAKAVTPGSILKIAEERMLESGWKVRRRVDAASSGAEVGEQRQKDREP